MAAVSADGNTVGVLIRRRELCVQPLGVVRALFLGSAASRLVTATAQ